MWPKVPILWGNHVAHRNSMLWLLHLNSCCWLASKSISLPRKSVFLFAPTLAASSELLRFILCFPVEVAQLRASNLSNSTDVGESGPSTKKHEGQGDCPIYLEFREPFELNLLKKKIKTREKSISFGVGHDHPCKRSLPLDTGSSFLCSGCKYAFLMPLVVDR